MSRGWAKVSACHLRGSKITHQYALEMCDLSWTPPLAEKDTALCVALKFECFTVSEGKERKPQNTNCIEISVWLYCDLQVKPPENGCVILVRNVQKKI